MLASTIQVGSVFQTDWLFNLQKIKCLIIIYLDLLSIGLVYTETVICHREVQFAEFHSHLITL